MGYQDQELFISVRRLVKRWSSEYLMPIRAKLVMACVVLKPGKALSADDLVSHCRRFLANYKVPRRVKFSEAELPKSGSGKILKRVLREHFWAHQERAVS
jgi:acyl-coenzyme A synthetase/AMP-(fatty) acid ligase